MSPDLERLVGRAFMNKEFRDKLLANSEGAIKEANLKLSKEEIASVKKGVEKIKSEMTTEQLDQQAVLRAWK